MEEKILVVALKEMVFKLDLNTEREDADLRLSGREFRREAATSF